MKVCTDACLLGAWTADKMQHFNKVENILDIGCGTGLLSLMLAQNTNAAIDAIEINSDAAKQAGENIAASPWANHINVINVSLQEFKSNKKYDLIISNPPFFEDDLRSVDENKNASKHDTTLTLDELLSFIKDHLNKGAHAAILIPFHRTDHLAALVKSNELFVTEILFVKPSPTHSYFRSVILISNEEKQPIETNELSIHDGERKYTEPFKALLSTYYLKL
jgi:tRNA1Val (adenine37-N6)-methyltransferase